MSELTFNHAVLPPCLPVLLSILDRHAGDEDSAEQLALVVLRKDVGRRSDAQPVNLYWVRKGDYLNLTGIEPCQS